MSVSYTDIVYAREKLRENGLALSHIELTEDDMDGLLDDDSFTAGSSGSVGTVNSIPVYQEENSVIVAENGETFEL